MTDTEDIVASIRTVTDPDLGDDVVSAGLVTDVTIDDGVVTLSVELAGLAPETAEETVEQMRSEVLSLAGVEQVRVDSENPTNDAEIEDFGIGADRIVAVASAKGGVGKSTVATWLARGLAEQGQKVGIFDADIHGPNVPQLLDAEGPVVATDDGHAAPVDAAGLSVMSIGLLDNDAPIAWRGAMAHEALLDLLTDTAWDGLDTLVVDLPPGTGDIVLTTLQDVPVDGVVLVTTPYPTAIDDTGRSATLFRENGVPILGSVVNMAGFTCPTCGDDHDLFDHDAVDSLNVPVLEELPFDASMRDPTGSLPERLEQLTESVQQKVVESGLEIPKNPLDVRDLPAGVPEELVTEEFAALDSGQELWIRTDRPPDVLLSAPDDHNDRDGETHEHGQCCCEHDQGGGPRQKSSELLSDRESVEAIDIQQKGPAEWVARIEKAANAVHSNRSPAN